MAWEDGGWHWEAQLAVVVAAAAARDMCGVSRVSHLDASFFLSSIYRITFSLSIPYQRQHWLHTPHSSRTSMVYITGDDGIARKYACKTCIKVSLQCHC